MYFAPGTSGNATALRLTLLHEITVNKTSPTPMAHTNRRAWRLWGQSCLR
jgi:hypothetical protein